MFKLKDVKICYARSLYAYVLLRRWKTGMGHNLTGDKSGGKKNSYHNHIWGTNFGGENFQIKKSGFEPKWYLRWKFALLADTVVQFNTIGFQAIWVNLVFKSALGYIVKYVAQLLTLFRPGGMNQPPLRFNWFIDI